MSEKHQTEYARRLRVNMTDAERVLWRHLRAKRFWGVQFRRQAPLGPYIVDFLSHNPKLVIEVDGSQHQDRQREDEMRDAWLQERGFKVLRFWNDQVLDETEAVLQIWVVVTSILPCQWERE
ncbi:endonuclease domain-containing protein [Methylothermus subterraneus]